MTTAKSPYLMVQPCARCPFRTDVEPYLTPDRVREIEHAVIEEQRDFKCHKTVDYSQTVYDEEGEESLDDFAAMKDSETCAGMMILCEKLERPTQLMRIFERVGRAYDRNRLKMDAPVFDTFEEMADAQLRENSPLILDEVNGVPDRVVWDALQMRPDGPKLAATETTLPKTKTKPKTKRVRTPAKKSAEQIRLGRPRARTIDMRTSPKNLSDAALLARAIHVTTDPETGKPITDGRFAELHLYCHERTLRKYLDGRPLSGVMREKVEGLIA